MIGYVAPGATKAGDQGNTTNFTYTGYQAAETTLISSVNNTLGWQAASNVDLNECKAGSTTWTVNVNKNSNGNALTYVANTTCQQLTPSFSLIGK